MLRTSLVSASVVLTLLASGIVASTAIGARASGGAEFASKAAFCGANDQIDRTTVNVSSAAGFLAVLKSHRHDLAILKKNAPSGSLGQQVQQLVSAAETALSTNSINPFRNAPSGAAIDTYCGVSGNGSPLPKYFATGKGSSFCSTFLPVFQAAGNEPDPAGVLASFKANQAQISQLSSELSTLPSSIRAKATSTVNNVQAAITHNSAATIQDKGGGAAMYVALYCGQNS